MDELGGIVDSDPGELAMAGGMATAALSPSPPLPAAGTPDVPRPSAGGSGTEFGQFYADHYVALVRLATVLSGSADVAPDLVQDCFVGLHRHWITVRDPLPYVRRSVVHACASHHRRAARVRGLHPPVPGNSELGADELEDAVAKLPPRQRAAVVLRYYGDLSDADIARALRCRPATVRSLVHRALADLRKVIEP